MTLEVLIGIFQEKKFLAESHHDNRRDVTPIFFTILKLTKNDKKSANFNL